MVSSISLVSVSNGSCTHVTTDIGTEKQVYKFVIQGGVKVTQPLVPKLHFQYINSTAIHSILKWQH